MHIKEKHRIVQLEQEEIDAWILMQINKEKALKISKLLNDLQDIKSEIITSSDKIIRAIKKSVEKSLDLIQKQVNLVKKSIIHEIDKSKIPKLNIEKLEKIIDLSQCIFTVNDNFEKEVKPPKMVVDYGNLIKRQK
jgi:hypothetical protein